MARVLMTWEMGGNLGHLSRLLPIAQGLLRHGLQVLVASCDCRIAAQTMGHAGIPFIAAPHRVGLRMAGGPTASYAEILLREGWSDATELFGLVHAWINIWRLFRPDVVVADHSPTALLAARITGTPPVAIGTGFEIPPLEDPLPPLPGFANEALRRGEVAERSAIENANRVLEPLRAPELSALKELFEGAVRRLTTLPELDHYGPRSAEQYIGPIGQSGLGSPIAWPAGAAKRVVVYLRPGVPQLTSILEALLDLDASVICYAPGVSMPQAERGHRSRRIDSHVPVDLDRLWTDADLYISYAPAGSVTASLLRGVPQLLAPAHAEAQLTAHRVECAGLGLTLSQTVTTRGVNSVIERLLETFDYRARARTFAYRYREVDSRRAEGALLSDVLRAAGETVSPGGTEII